MPHVRPAPHEGDIHLIFGVHPDEHEPDTGLQAYYALDSTIKDRTDEEWQKEGKPTASTEFNGDRYALALDYDKSGLDPWESPDFQLESVREFRLYFVDKDSPHYNGESADQDTRVKGGTITVRPRWPGMTSDGEKVSVPNYGGPYIDCQVQASNIPHTEYHTLVKRVFSAFDINSRYLREPHPDSTIQDLAYYVRIERGESGPLFAPDGPISRAHQLIQGDRSGYRKHEEDHTKLPGYYVTAAVEDEKADALVKGHGIGKELKHYYPREPDSFDASEAPYHPKFEVSYQTARTDGTVRWDDLEAARRELQETLLNCLEWCGMSTRSDAGFWVDIDPYWQVRDTHESRKIVPCPLPDIEDEQEHRIMKLWGDMTNADREVTELLLADGGKVSPQEAADETNNTYRTIRAVIDRMDGLIRHTYGELELESKKIQQELQKRVRAAGERFEQSIGSAAMELADAADKRVRSAWDRWRREYAVSVDDNPKDCRKLFRIGYKPKNRTEAAKILREGLTALSPSEMKQMKFGTEWIFETEEGERESFDKLHRMTSTAWKQITTE
jgi:hypothetical protein